MPDVPDPLGRDTRYPHATVLPLLGVPTRFAATHALLLELVEETFGGWRKVTESAAAGDEEEILIRLHLDEAPPEGPAPAPVRYRLPEPTRLLVFTPGSQGFADRERGDAVAYLTPELAADRAHAGHAFLSTLALFLATRRDRLPLHAAALYADGAALLLHGASGVGKSTLCLAAALEGWRVLAEDVVYLQREPSPRIWGMPGSVHVPAASLELLGVGNRDARPVRAGGRTKLALRLDELGAEAPEPHARRGGICLLRADGPERPVEISSDEVAAALTHGLEPGFDLYPPEEQAKAAEILAREGAWLLGRGPDPRRTLRHLQACLEAVASPTPPGRDASS